MKDFLDQLDGRLTAIAAPDRDPSADPRRAGRRRPTKLAGLTAVLATVAAAFTMSGTSVAELPILGTPTTDISGIRDDVPAVAEAGVDFSKAHVYGTAGGPGYALVNDATDTICLVAPDARSPGDYGSSCARPIAKVEAEGMSLQIVRDTAADPRATSTTIVLLPEDATDVRITTERRTSEPRIDAGVATFELREDGTLSWKVDGQRRERVYFGPFRTRALSIQCPNGLTALTAAPPAGISGRDVIEFISEQRPKVCSR